MRSALYARIVFGLSAVVYGVAGFMWHDSVAWQLAHSTPIAWCLAIAQVVFGIGIMLPRSERPSSIVLGVVYTLFALSSAPGMITAPLDPGSYVNFFEQLALVCGAIAVNARSRTLGRTARLTLGICTLSFAWAQVVYLQYTASLVPTWIPPNQVFWTWLTTIAFALAGIAILINVRARLAMRLMALMMALFGILVWVPHLIAQPHLLSNYDEISSNYLMTAAVWLVAEVRSF
ncbi:MAG: hypothetical protein ABSE64_11965 [Vulcanimicrobiaceae bacterium]